MMGTVGMEGWIEGDRALGMGGWVEGDGEPLEWEDG